MSADVEGLTGLADALTEALRALDELRDRLDEARDEADHACDEGTTEVSEVTCGTWSAIDPREHFASGYSSSVDIIAEYVRDSATHLSTVSVYLDSWAIVFHNHGSTSPFIVGLIVGPEMPWPTGWRWIPYPKE